MVVYSENLPNSEQMDTLATQKDPAEFSRALADRLRNLREKSGLSQESVAHQAGISTYTYQKFEKGESKPVRHESASFHASFSRGSIWRRCTRLAFCR